VHASAGVTKDTDELEKNRVYLICEANLEVAERDGKLRRLGGIHEGGLHREHLKRDHMNNTDRE
jgi:hypothetical protein